MARREGQLLAEDFFENVGGMNTAYSPFIIPRNQSAGGYNYDYISQGAILKRGGHARVNPTPNDKVKSLGIGLWNTSSDTREIIRIAGRKVQNFDPDALTFTNMSLDDTGASTDIFPVSTVPVLTSMFNNALSSVLWMSGSAATAIYGVVSATKVTQNGVAVPTASSFTATAGGSGGTLATGTYRYTLTYRKTTTQAESNGLLEATVSVTSGQTVTLAWTLTNNDTTLYDKIIVYRSAVSGAAQFTTGDLVTLAASSATGYVDTGSSVTSSTNVPRSGGTVDNGVLPAGTPIGCAVWKRRLVTAINSTIYFSDLNKSESWPSVNTIQVPTGGKITGFGVISFTSRGSSEIDELLVVFKQSEVWVVTGTSISDVALKFVDSIGCPYQSLVTAANGYIYWASDRGFQIWNGTGKPGYLSRFIEDKFQQGGDIDKSKFGIGFANYSQKRNEVAWTLSSGTYGENMIRIRLDLKLTLGSVDEAVGVSVVPGVFTPELLTAPMYAGATFFKAAESSEESYYLGDSSGYLYEAYSALTDGGAGFTVQYPTPFLSLGPPGSCHQYHKVVAWVVDTGDWDLRLDYWTQFRFATSESNTVIVPITQGSQGEGLVWDVGNWDEEVWDGQADKIVPVIFNLNNLGNNNQGDSIKLQISQTDTVGNGSSVKILGFTIYYTDLPLRK